MDESIVKHFEQGQVGKMKLSAAIRLGAKLRPQGFGGGFARDGTGTSCALQAGAEAVTGRLIPGVMGCSEALGIDDSMAFKIYIMNDVKYMSREQIADELERQGL